MKIETLEVSGFKTALHGMRSPWSSWKKSDTQYVIGSDRHYSTNGQMIYYGDLVTDVCVGDADAELSKKLQKAGTEHCKHLRMIHASADITAPLYWWKQMDCYKLGVEKVSTSTMHTLLAKPFEMSDFYFDTMPGYKVEPKQFIPEVNEDEEQWVDHMGYKVSSEGRVRNASGKEIKGVLHKDGYRFMWFNGKIVSMHRIIAKCFCEGQKEGMVVDHIDGNKQNNKASNLEWVTTKENTDRAKKNHLQPNHAKAYEGKFTEEERKEIISLYETGEYSKRELGRMIGVSHTTICNITNGKFSYTGGTPNYYQLIAKPTVNELNRLRDEYFEEEDKERKKEIWQAIISLLPESYLQKRTVQMNYAALRNIYHQRKGHKLLEWSRFLEWIESLPESWMITD